MRSLKNVFIVFIFLFILLVSPSFALSENNASADITNEVVFKAENGITDFSKITDSDVDTYISFSDKDTLTVTVPNGSVGGYISLGWLKVPDAYDISYNDTNGQQKTLKSAGGMLHETITVSDGFTSAKITFNKGSSLCEIKVYSSGDALPEIQTWLPTVSKADLMVIAAHPDDEMLFMGGTIPYYAGECKKNTVVMYMTHQKRLRQTEALNGLWVAGLKTYPVFAGFPDKYSNDPDVVAASWGGEDNVIKYLVEQIRRYKPEVIVTHDVNGEYGHGAHRLIADCIQKAVLAAKDETKYADSYNKYGAYEVKKLYLHLYSKNKITMNWHIPLINFNGKTALQIAEAGYAQHLSQHDLPFKVLDTGKTSCAEFGLCYTSVGNDVNKNDFLENIPVISDTVSPSDEINATPSDSSSVNAITGIQPLKTINSLLENFFPFIIGVLAVLIAALITALVLIIKKCTKKALKNFLVTSLIILIIIILAVTAWVSYYYLKQAKPTVAQAPPAASASPSVSSDPASASPSYLSDVGKTSSADLNGYFMQGTDELVVNNFEDGIWMYRSNSLSITIEKKQLCYKKAVYYVADIRTRNGELPFAAMAEEGNGTARDWPYLLSRKNNAVFGVTSDFLIVQDAHLKGVLIRNGKVYSDKKGEDTLAVMPNGELKIFRKGTVTAKELIEMGVNNSYSFGPTLINDGIIEKGLDKHRLRTNNPRSSVGMIEPGHYIFIVVDGRDSAHSVGVTFQELAALYASYGVKVAYAMDGGSSSGMVFMGNSVSQHNMNINWGQRRNPDLIAFGKSDSVPDINAPVINKGNGVDVGVKVDTETDTSTDTTTDTDTSIGTDAGIGADTGT